jgi:hypothetical protein
LGPAVAEVGQGVTELVRKLEAILGPMNVLGRQANRDAATWRSLEIGLRMIGPVIDVDTAEFGPRTVAPNFKGNGLQKGGQICGTSRTKSVYLNTDVKRSRFIRGLQRNVRLEPGSEENCQWQQYPGDQRKREESLPLPGGHRASIKKKVFICQDWTSYQKLDCRLAARPSAYCGGIEEQARQIEQDDWLVSIL